MEQQVPADCLPRSIGGSIDLLGIREHLRPSSSSTGRPWVGSELIIRMRIMAYCTGYQFGAAAVRGRCQPRLPLVRPLRAGQRQAAWGPLRVCYQLYDRCRGRRDRRCRGNHGNTAGSGDGPTPECDASRPCLDMPFDGARCNPLTLPARPDSQHRDYQIGEVGSRIDHGFGKRRETSLSILHCMEDAQQVVGFAGKAVGCRHLQRSPSSSAPMACLGSGRSAVGPMSRWR